MKSVIATLLMVTLIAAAGCENSTSTMIPHFTLVRPGVGSEFVFRRMYWDTNNVLVQNYLDTEVVYKSGISFAGKDSVIVMSSIHDTSLQFPIYYNYEPNGDFDDYSDVPGVRDGWRTYPIATGGSTTFIQEDTTLYDTTTGVTQNVQRDFFLTYEKDTSLVEAGQSMNAIDILFQAGDEYSLQNFRADIWIAPSIGMEIRTVEIIYPPYPQDYSRWEFDLVSYTLK